MILIFSYNRPEFLRKVIEDCPVKPYVIDDGSDFDPMPFARLSYFHKLEHKGREQFYLNWQYAFEICKQSDEDFFLFIPDDFLNVNHSKIKHIYDTLQGRYAYNLLNDARPQIWTPIKHHDVEVAGVPSERVSYADCGYFTNRETLQAINFTQDDISVSRFDRSENSSGVGWSQSRRFHKKFVPMYIPKKSLCFHGAHESMMHKELRKKQPLISR
jgi:hypothetical protein